MACRKLHNKFLSSSDRFLPRIFINAWTGVPNYRLSRKKLPFLTNLRANSGGAHVGLVRVLGWYPPDYCSSQHIV